MGIEIYNEEEYNTWVQTHSKWMRNNLPVEMVDAFESELESLISVKDKHGFMLFHLLHMSALTEDDDYEYLELAKTTWDLPLPMVQAFNTLMMGVASKAGDEKTFHAIALSNALMLQMFTSAPMENNINDSEE